jgi:hypothetical protein
VEVFRLGPSSVFLAHAPADRDYAVRLADFLESGCDVRCNLDAGVMEPGEDLIEKVEQGSEILILLLSKHSWPSRLPRERWDPILLETPLISVLIEDCPIPELLRRKNFIDARKHNAGRELKRRIWREARGLTEADAVAQWSPDLAELYASIADQPGASFVDGATAARFVKEAADDFDAILWVPCFRRSLVESAGELGSRLGAVLDGELDENCRRIEEFLTERRLLLVLDAPDEDVLAAFPQCGRTSILITQDPVEILSTDRSFEYALELVSQRRFAEAYDLLCPLMDELTDVGSCARELAGICDHWGRLDEADRWRAECDLMPTQQLTLFD